MKMNKFSKCVEVLSRNSRIFRKKIESLQEELKLAKLDVQKKEEKSEQLKKKVETLIEEKTEVEKDKIL